MKLIIQNYGNLRQEEFYRARDTYSFHHNKN